MARRGYGTPPGYEGVKPGKNAKPKIKPPKRKAVDTKPPAIPVVDRPGQRPNRIPMSLSAIPVVAPPIVSTTAVTSVPGVATPEWWRGQYTSDPRYLAQAPQLSQEYSNIGEQYGLVVGRVTDAASPYYGRVIFRTGGEAPGSGSIVQDFDATTGRPVYRNIATGEIVQVDPQTLALDIRELRPDEPGYRGGELGGARLQSAGRQVKVGEQASQAGARSSGMRIVGASAEIQALQDALSAIARRSGESLAGVNRRYMELYNDIYQDLVRNPPAGPPSTTAITSVTSVGELPPTTAPSPDLAPSGAGPDIPMSGSGASYRASGVPKPPALVNQRVESVLRTLPADQRVVGRVVYKWRPKGKKYNVEAVITSISPFVITYRKEPKLSAAQV